MDLFNKIFTEQINNTFDAWPSCDEWRIEIDKWLSFINRKNEMDRYISRLKGPSIQRDIALNEIYAAYYFETYLKYNIIGFEEKTIGNRDVDFVINDNHVKILCEVKSPGWGGELNEQEYEERIKKEKYINGECRSSARWLPIRYSIKKANEKFISNRKCIVIIVDDLFCPVSSLDFEIALFNNSTLYNNEFGYFADQSYKNVSGLLYLKCYLISDDKFIHINNYFQNPFALNPCLIRTINSGNLMYN